QRLEERDRVLLALCVHDFSPPPPVRVSAAQIDPNHPSSVRALVDRSLAPAARATPSLSNRGCRRRHRAPPFSLVSSRTLVSTVTSFLFTTRAIAPNPSSIVCAARPSTSVRFNCPR